MLISNVCVDREQRSVSPLILLILAKTSSIIAAIISNSLHLDRAIRILLYKLRSHTRIKAKDPRRTRLHSYYERPRAPPRACTIAHVNGRLGREFQVQTPGEVWHRLLCKRTPSYLDTQWVRLSYFFSFCHVEKQEDLKSSSGMCVSWEFCGRTRPCANSLDINLQGAPDQHAPF